jgi:dihydroorotate dehydrogenase
VGGIHSPQDALDKIAAGATLVQLYTGFIYEGPQLVSEINKAILNTN